MKTRKPNSLTNKEKEEINWAFVAGKTTTEIARKFGISRTTVKYYRNPEVHKARWQRYYKKLKARGGRKRIS